MCLNVSVYPVASVSRLCAVRGTRGMCVCVHIHERRCVLCVCVDGSGDRECVRGGSC